MIFSAREDIDAPQASVWAAVTDFEAFERQAQRRGARVRRVGKIAPPSEGARWDIGFRFRGKDRDVDALLSTCTEPKLVLLSAGSGINGTLDVELIPLAASKTRIIVKLELKPQTVAARMLLNAMKLTKAALTQRFKDRVAKLARMVETSS